jgi:hypothetical protein
VNTVANAALPVALGLLVLGALAHVVLVTKVGDAKLQRFARLYLVPLGNWCLIALGVHVFAIVAAGRTGIVALGVSLAIAGAAVLIQTVAEGQAAAPEEPAPAAPPAAAPAPAAPPAAAPAPTSAPAPGGSLWAHRH